MKPIVVKESRPYCDNRDFQFFIDELEGGGFAIKCVPKAKGYMHSAYATLQQAATVLDRMNDQHFDYTTYRVNFSSDSNPCVVYDMVKGTREFIDGVDRRPVELPPSRCPGCTELLELCTCKKGS